MTLLIGTISKNCVVLTADGISRPNPITGGGEKKDDLQKIFPHESLPIAIVHHGFNIIDGQPVRFRIMDFFDSFKDDIANLSIKDISNQLMGFMDSYVEQTLMNPNNRGGVGFWVSGFGISQNKPTLFEIFWPSDVTLKEHNGIILGGDGKVFISEYLHKKLGTFSPKINRVKQYKAGLAAIYHDKLYDKAEKNQRSKAEYIFGGKKHQLVIKKSGCEWLLPPIS
jgi:hypothetical protein